MLMAISASVIQVIGLIPPYFELAKRHGRVIGIDFWFLTIDYAGAFFSLMAVVAQQWFDALGASLYIACMALETGIFVSQAVWMWRVREIRRKAKKRGLSYDEYVAKYPERVMSVEDVRDVEACHGEEERRDGACGTEAREKEGEKGVDATGLRAEEKSTIQSPPLAVVKS